MERIFLDHLLPTDYRLRGFRSFATATFVVTLPPPLRVVVLVCQRLMRYTASTINPSLLARRSPLQFCLLSRCPFTAHPHVLPAELVCL